MLESKIALTQETDQNPSFEHETDSLEKSFRHVRSLYNP